MPKAFFFHREVVRKSEHFSQDSGAEIRVAASWKQGISRSRTCISRRRHTVLGMITRPRPQRFSPAIFFLSLFIAEAAKQQL